MSGHYDDAVIQHGISSQADAFIQKPFHPQGLGQKTARAAQPAIKPNEVTGQKTIGTD